ncbi:hypothetical protein CQW23_26656 [Capsicum baccatum]|uniref:Bifunctional inhibitor/plant lipid transfer protein/seed storage helical domain-containing protein n=1 Tax=Capsicum baccatum TaxID=33114 RepID=A0A2G2VPG2_CAPBA|nr:hypothetical protein CQW23_26656 [Capsicum baccatum]
MASTTTFLILILISLFSTILTPSVDAQTMPPMAAAEPPSMAMSPAAASGPATSGGMDCMTVLINMSSCLTFVEQGSNLTKPDKECCPSLAGLLDSNPICLCQLLGDPTKTGVQIDVNRALKLPNICKLETPPVSTCAALGIPVAAPTSAEVPTASPGGFDSSPATASEVPALSPGGFASSPTSSEDKNNAASVMPFFKMQLVLSLGIMFFTIIY